eukprot:TRINITY_DN19584_c0_g1_i1.p1 TRINITY_DN19584_c0_g1~~TRINITY_DN19584_c0_g1_i1.p1  ORF type:complete len:161 (+),score=48.21 TRINITY_DN19584_c0_g1_i1:118-600(+)
MPGEGEVKVRFLPNEQAVDIKHGVDEEGNAVVSNDVVGGDYMVVDLAFQSEPGTSHAIPCTFDLLVNGFGFEIGQHDRSFGMTRKLSSPVISMIPCPAKKAALCTAATGKFSFSVGGSDMMVDIPNFTGPRIQQKFSFRDLRGISIVLGGCVSVTLKNVQ